MPIPCARYWRWDPASVVWFLATLSDQLGRDFGEGAGQPTLHICKFILIFQWFEEKTFIALRVMKKNSYLLSMELYTLGGWMGFSNPLFILPQGCIFIHPHWLYISVICPLAFPLHIVNSWRMGWDIFITVFPTFGLVSVVL